MVLQKVPSVINDTQGSGSTTPGTVITAGKNLRSATKKMWAAPPEGSAGGHVEYINKLNLESLRLNIKY